MERDYILVVQRNELRCFEIDLNPHFVLLKIRNCPSERFQVCCLLVKSPIFNLFLVVDLVEFFILCFVESCLAKQCFMIIILNQRQLKELFGENSIDKVSLLRCNGKFHGFREVNFDEPC